MHRRGWFTCHLRATSHRRISSADIAVMVITGILGTTATGSIIATIATIVTADTAIDSALARSVLESPC